jgi:hypothetical protein
MYVLLALALAAAPTIPAPVRAATDSVCRPLFLTDQGPLSAGTAFVAKPRPDAKSLLVTALHLFGPAGGLERQIPADGLQLAVASVACRALKGDKQVKAGHPWTIRGARPVSTPGPARDVVAFPVTTPVKALPLATAPSAKGERVWLVGEPRAGAAPGEVLHAGRVRGYEEGWLLVEMSNTDLVLNGTSGAPFVNERGEIVGINVSALDEKGALVSVAVGAQAVAALLATGRAQ